MLLRLVTYISQHSRLLALGAQKVSCSPKQPSPSPCGKLCTSRATLHVPLTNVNAGHSHPLLTQKPHLSGEMDSRTQQEALQASVGPQLTRRHLAGSLRRAFPCRTGPSLPAPHLVLKSWSITMTGPQPGSSGCKGHPSLGSQRRASGSQHGSAWTRPGADLGLRPSSGSPHCDEREERLAVRPCDREKGSRT